jgi:hypothetical protein
MEASGVWAETQFSPPIFLQTGCGAGHSHCRIACRPEPRVLLLTIYNFALYV